MLNQKFCEIVQLCIFLYSNSFVATKISRNKNLKTASTRLLNISLFPFRKEKEELIKALILMKVKFPNALEYASELAMEYLKRRQFRKAVNEYELIIKRWPNKALKEKVLLGLILTLTKKVND